MNRSSHRRLLPAGLALLVLLAACGGGDDTDDDVSKVDDTPSETDGAAADAGTACELLMLDEVSELFGEAAAVVPGGGDGAPDSTCLWESEAAEEDPLAIRRQLSLSVFEDDRDLDPSAWGQGPEPIDDLGDEAFVVSDDALGAATAGYRQDQRSVILTYLVGDAAADPADNEDDLVDLLRATEER